jgi:hypothetical protein
VPAAKAAAAAAAALDTVKGVADAERYGLQGLIIYYYMVKGVRCGIMRQPA